MENGSLSTRKTNSVEDVISPSLLPEPCLSQLASQTSPKMKSLLRDRRPHPNHLRHRGVSLSQTFQSPWPTSQGRSNLTIHCRPQVLPASSPNLPLFLDRFPRRLVSNSYHHSTSNPLIHHVQTHTRPEPKSSNRMPSTLGIHWSRLDHPESVLSTCISPRTMVAAGSITGATPIARARFLFVLTTAGSSDSQFELVAASDFPTIPHSLDTILRSS